MRNFVRSFTKRPVFNVATPTSGDLKVIEDKIQYDLTWTTYYHGQQFYSLKEFERFLITYYNGADTERLYKEILNKISPADVSDLNVQLLMQLSLLGYNQYQNVFDDYVKVDNPASRYALAELMGNIKSERSRNTLFTLLSDSYSLVQGLAVRQLESEPPQVIGPIFLQHLKGSSDLNFGPSNVMNPVMNRIDGGKAEIIRALGELKYRPAISDLLLLLDTEDERLFRLVISALKNIGSKEYVPYINRHLDSKNYELIFDISRLIVEDSLVECLQSFKNFIATGDRTRNRGFERVVSTCCGIGFFKDDNTVSFLLSDFDRFLSNKDNIGSFSEERWIRQYIETFADLKLQGARPLIYKALQDWYGLNEDFGLYPELFDTKSKLEDSLKQVFKQTLTKKGYSIDHCIAFIQNTKDVAQGTKPVANFLLESTVPYQNGAYGTESQQLIAETLNLPESSVYLRFDNDVYYIEKQYRFDKATLHTPLGEFLNYAGAVPNQNDISFLQALLDHKVITGDYEVRKTQEVIASINSPTAA